MREPKRSEQAEQRVREDIDRVELRARRKGTPRGAHSTVKRRPSVNLLSAKPRGTGADSGQPFGQKTRRG